MGFKKMLFGISATVALMAGFGSAIDISSCDDLANINNDLGTGYTLTQDLDCSGSGNSIMIGTNMLPFVGSFDGGNHSITVAFDTGYSGTYGGLFRYVTAGGSISNLTVLGTIHLDATEVGGVAGRVYQGSLDNVHFSGNIIVGENQVSIGGIAGRLEDSMLQNSSTQGSITALLNSSTVGGLVGLLSNNATISGSYASIDASGFYNVGGLVGESYDSAIQNSYALGDIEARGVHGGGMLGYADNTSVSNSYALGDVYAEDNAGSLVGNVRGLTVIDSYAIGSVGVATGNSGVGGLFGGIEGGMNALPNNVDGYFWDVDTSDMPGYFLNAIGDGTTGLTTAEMKYNVSNFLNAGWDFTGTWDINHARNDGYPFLQWQTFDTTRGSEVSVYMNNNTSGAPATQQISIEYTNNQDSDLTGVVLTLYGNIYSTGYQEASGGNNPTFSGIVEGSYIQWTIPSFPKNVSGVLDLLITQPVDGSYVYTATIAAPYNTEYYPGNNSFHITSIVDTVTQAPTLLTPTTSSSHINTDAMSISFVLPELLLSNSLLLRFVPDASGANTITLNLMDANPFVTNTFAIVPAGNLSTVTEVVSTTANSVPNGTYTVVLSYQDIYGNPAISTNATSITIADPEEDNGGGNGGGGGGGGGGQGAIMNRAPTITPAMWKAFYTQHMDGATSAVGDVFTVKAFISDVFKLLGIIKPINRKPEHETQEVPQKLVNKVMQVLVKLLAAK